LKSIGLTIQFGRERKKNTIWAQLIALARERRKHLEENFCKTEVGILNFLEILFFKFSVTQKKRSVVFFMSSGLCANYVTTYVDVLNKKVGSVKDKRLFTIVATANSLFMPRQSGLFTYISINNLVSIF